MMHIKRKSVRPELTCYENSIYKTLLARQIFIERDHTKARPINV